MSVTASMEVDSNSVVMEERVDKTCLSDLAEVLLLQRGGDLNSPEGEDVPPA